MKNIKYFCSFCTIILLGIIICTGCKKDDNPVSSNDALVGTWVLTKVSYTYQQQTNEMTPEEAGMQMTITLNSDNTYNATFNMYDSPETDLGTWSATSTQLTITSNSDGVDQIMPYTLNGNKLILTMVDTFEEETMEMRMEFTKQ